MKILLYEEEWGSRERLKELILREHPGARLELCRASTRPARCPAEEEEVLIFPTRQRSYFLKRSQIFYVENEGKKVVLHTDAGQIPVYASMKEMEGRLGEGFFRSHRGFLVNLDHVASYSADEIAMRSGDTVYLSRKRYRDFTESYQSYIHR